ncbi:hypothetical protein BH11ARM1_BH11ARM1_00950 [soil metagenome]
MLPFALLMVSGVYIGTIKLHLTDAHNRPIANHEAWLVSTNSTKPIRPFGVQWWIPEDWGYYHGKTDANGDIAIPGLPVEDPMMVITKFGPRFDSLVGEEDRGTASVDVIKYEGAVYPGKPSHMLLANDYEISGKVTDASRKPLKGVTVFLSDTGIGHMSGRPQMVLDQQETDSGGNYRFKKLPNCEFEIMASADPGHGIESRPGKGAWKFLEIVDQYSSSQLVTLRTSKTICDFRISITAKLTVKFKGTPSEFKGWSVWVQMGLIQEGGGQSLDYDSSSSTFAAESLAGPITIWISRSHDFKSIRVKELTLKPSESRKIEISMAEILKGKLVDYPLIIR